MPLGWLGQRLRAKANSTPLPGRVLVTGASGQVAAMLLPRWNAALGDIAPPPRTTDLRASGADQADLSLVDDCRRVLEGVDAVVHLAGHAKEASLAQLWTPNVLALSNLLHSAAEAGIRRFVFASSMHVMGLYERSAELDERMPPRPDSHYATTKLHGEALCRLYAERHGMAITCLRLGAVAERFEDVEPGSWISPEDVLGMLRIALAASPPWFEIFHAVADARGSPLAPSRAMAFGYRCSRPGEDYAASLARAARWWAHDELARTRRGASFASEALR
jgi:uronate dehydrogenase